MSALRGAGRAPTPRWFELLAATLGWFLISPLLALLAVFVRLDSPGPIVFRQVRIGRGGRPFAMLKLRTMRTATAAPSAAADAVEIAFERFVFTPNRPDPRVTPIGRVLRRTSLDEMPQLANVIRGDMSIVGPRPEMAAIVRQYPAAFHVRHQVRPGITGLAQIKGRADLTYAQTIRYDLAYVRRRSLRNDIAILARTFGSVLRGEGAR